MRDIVQVSVGVRNPFAGTFSAGSKIETITPEDLDDGFLDINGYLFMDSDLYDLAELFNDI